MLLELHDDHLQVNFSFEPMLNNQMPFLDCLVIREGNNFEVKVYKNQQTRVDTFITLLSNAVPNIKASGISELTRRAKLICTKNRYLAEDLQYITATMVVNGYYKSFVEKEIERH